MVKITGKQAVVSYDVITQDSEVEQILEQIIASTLNPLINKDKQKLKEMMNVPKQLPSHTISSQPNAQQSKFSKENLEPPQLIPLGGKWAYSVALVVDESGDKSVRIAKGTIVGGRYFDKETNEYKLKPDDPMKPIKQIGRINVKSLSEWTAIYPLVLPRLQQIEKEKEKAKQ